MRIVLITGISGSGKSVALNVLEDADYYCVDNLPTEFLVPLTASLEKDGYARIAVAIDARAGQSITQLPEIVAQLRAHHDVRVLFLNADVETLVQRFSETRRRHPLTGRTGKQAVADIGNAGDATTSLLDAIELERELLGTLAELGHQIDTSNLRTHALRAWVKEFIEHDRRGLTLMFESFGFKYGVPRDADLVFDVRALPNPHYEPALKPQTGLDAPVAEFLAAQPEVVEMIADIRAFVAKWLPAFIRDNRSYLTVAIGCTGGQHRSVYIVEQLAKAFANDVDILIRHRQLSRPAAS